jgi:hypothetical protein
MANATQAEIDKGYHLRAATVKSKYYKKLEDSSLEIEKKINDGGSATDAEKKRVISTHNKKMLEIEVGESKDVLTPSLDRLKLLFDRDTDETLSAAGIRLMRTRALQAEKEGPELETAIHAGTKKYVPGAIYAKVYTMRAREKARLTGAAIPPTPVADRIANFLLTGLRSRRLAQSSL